MPAELLLVGNPARRRKAASPAQRRARAAFAAAARARSLPNPARRRSRRRRSVARSHRRIRRNPIGGSALRGLMPMLKAAGMGGAGAIAVDVGYGFAVPYLPPILATPIAEGGGINPAYYLGKGAFTIALGVIAKKALGAKAGTMTEGALAVLAHDAMKQFVQGANMGITLGRARRGGPGGRLSMYAQPGNRLPAPGGGLGMYASAGEREAVLR